MNRITFIFASISLCMLVACIGCNTYKPNITFTEAIKAGNEKAINYYLKKGALVNQKDENGDLPLVLAAERGNERVVKKLLKAGADTEGASENGATALFIASFKGDGPIVEELLKAGALVNTLCAVNGSVLNKYYTGSSPLFKMAFESKPNSKGKISPLSGAMYNEHANIVRRLAQAGANVNEDPTDNTPSLNLASMVGYVEVVKELINSGADVNARDNVNGATTALMAASLFGHKDVVKELLNAHADINAKALNGMTALKFAKKKGHADIVKLLKDAGAKE